MSLRQKGNEFLFADFIKEHFSHSGYRLPEPFSPTDLTHSLFLNRLYEKTLLVLEDLQNQKPDSKGPAQVCDSLCRHFKLSKFYLFTVDRNRKQVVMAYSYPTRGEKDMLVNQPFIKKLSEPDHVEKCIEVIKSYFRIDIPNLEFEILFQGKEIHILLYRPETGGTPKDYSRIFNFIFHSPLQSPLVRQNPSPKTVPASEKKPSGPKPPPSIPQTAERINIPPKKVYLYQRLMSSLPILTGGSEEDVNRSMKLLLQIAKFSQVILTDGHLKQIFGIYSLTQADRNRIKGVLPAKLKEEFSQEEKKHHARKVKSRSGKTFLLFFREPIHPQKKSPELPFPSYLDTLEQILLRRAPIGKKK